MKQLAARPRLTTREIIAAARLDAALQAGASGLHPYPSKGSALGLGLHNSYECVRLPDASAGRSRYYVTGLPQDAYPDGCATYIEILFPGDPRMDTLRDLLRPRLRTRDVTSQMHTSPPRPHRQQTPGAPGMHTSSVIRPKPPHEIFSDE